MSERRRVRVTEQFFGRLDELLPAERTPSGEPSATDFEGTTMPTPSQPTVRALIAAGLLVPYLAVYVELAEDGSVEAFYLDIG